MSINIIETKWKWNSTLIKRSSTKYIALHHAAASIASAAQVDEWHKAKGWAGIGYHFYVRKDGSIYRGRPLDKMGAQVSGKNDASIGICAEGDYTTEQMPNVQETAIAELLDYLKSKYYPNAEIVGHGEIGASSCPGNNYPLDELKNYQGILKGGDEAMCNNCKVYHYWNEIPDEFLPTVKKLAEKGYFTGEAEDDLNLPECMMRMMLINNRAGLYDK